MNPSHLKAGSQHANVIDMIRKGRGANQSRPLPNYNGRKPQRKKRKRAGVSIPKCYLTPERRGPIINLVGPPGAGKSTLADLLADVKAYKIDDYRAIHRENRRSWHCLLADVMADPACVIVESSGLSRRIDDLREIAERQGRKFKTVIVTAPAEACLGRLSESRRKNKIADVSFTIDQMVVDCVRKLPSMYENAIHIDGSKPAEDGAEVLRNLCHCG